MLIPIRCMCCGKPVAHLYLKYIEYIRSEKDESTDPSGVVNVSRQEFLEKDLGLKRYCCKKEITTCVDIMDKI